MKCIFCDKYKCKHKEPQEDFINMEKPLKEISKMVFLEKKGFRK